MSIGEYAESRSSTSILRSIVPSIEDDVLAPRATLSPVEDELPAPLPVSAVSPVSAPPAPIAAPPIAAPSAAPRVNLAAIPATESMIDDAQTLVRPPATPIAAPARSVRENRAAPAPKKSGWLGVIVAALGVLLGGGAVAVIGAIVGLLLLLGLGGAATWYLFTLPAAELPDAVTVTPVPDASASGPSDAVDPTVAATGPGAGTESPKASSPAPSAPAPSVHDAAPSAPAPSSPASSAPASSAPVATTPAPAPAPAATPAPSKPAPAAPPPAAKTAPSAAGTVSIKLLSDPPAARIVLDGEAKGFTPAKIDVTKDTHQLIVESGKSSGTFTIDSGDESKFCFGVSGKKVVRTSCD